VITIPEDVLAKLEKMDADFRFVHKQCTPQKGMGEDKSGLYCEVICRKTGQIICARRGADQMDAVTNAVEGAVRSPKPMTKAQLEDPELVELIRKFNLTRASKSSEADADLTVEDSLGEEPPKKRGRPSLGKKVNIPAGI
jgi:hypothetical protein